MKGPHGEAYRNEAGIWNFIDFKAWPIAQTNDWGDAFWWCTGSARFAAREWVLA